MAQSVGVIDIVTLNGTPSSTNRCIIRSSGMYVSVIASKSQSSSRKYSCSGCRTKGKCACRMSARKPEGIGDFGFRTAKKYNGTDYSIRNPRSPIRNRLERPAKVLETVETFFDDVDAGGLTKPDGAVVAKSSARDNGDVHQHIERTLRLHRSYVRNFGNAIEHVIAPHIEFFTHIGKRLLIAL